MICTPLGSTSTHQTIILYYHTSNDDLSYTRTSYNRQGTFKLQCVESPTKQYWDYYIRSITPTVSSTLQCLPNLTHRCRFNASIQHMRVWWGAGSSSASFEYVVGYVNKWPYNCTHVPQPYGHPYGWDRIGESTRPSGNTWPGSSQPSENSWPRALHSFKSEGYLRPFHSADWNMGMFQL